MNQLFCDLPEKARIDMTRRMNKFNSYAKIEAMRKQIKREMAVQTILGWLAFLALAVAIAVMVAAF